jgi:hypothetical protein
VDAEQLFVRYFLPLYPPDARADLARARAEDANPAGNPSLLAHLSATADQFVANARALFDEDLRLDRTDASVHRLAAALTAERRDTWAARGAEGTADNVLFNAVVHGAAYVGACVVASHGATWGVRRPLWESVVRLRSRAGEGDLAVYHWWLKSLADDALMGLPEARSGATLADRYRAHVEVPCATPEELPVLVVGPRPLPRLKQPRYDLLYKYLRAHLPELRDLGADFPTAERFEAYGFRWMDFHVLGGLREERLLRVRRVPGSRGARGRGPADHDDERVGRGPAKRDAVVGAVTRGQPTSGCRGRRSRDARPWGARWSSRSAPGHRSGAGGA